MCVQSDGTPDHSPNGLPMTTSPTPTATVLLVKQNPEKASAYENQLRPTYDVRTAHTGGTALHQIDSTVDAVLLDQHLPDMSSHGILHQIRARDLDCRVALITGTDSIHDVQISGFDECQQEPQSSDELHALVATLVSRKQYDQLLDEYYRSVASLVLLQELYTESELHDKQPYHDLKASIERTEQNLSEVTDRLIELGALDQLFDELCPCHAGSR